MIAPGTPLFDLDNLGKLTEGVFITRPNRFVALARVKGTQVRVHVADTGRLEEILTPNRPLLLLKNRPGMKTNFTLIAAKMEEGWVLINTRLHAPIARKAIELGVLGFTPQHLKSEVTFGQSRFDYLADETYIELKGCSLVQQNRCRFPNAPTQRGVKHLKELMEARKKGFDAALLIMALRPCACFEPHPERDEAFRRTFFEAMENGVDFKGFHIKIEGNDIRYDGPLALCL
ncbi:MAG: DNA/RNA nuclease SfsA [Epsilonproteobacteria bacterium]|nr:DNA/RNA nuclease SfsA [Campylobacterota bacterium]